MDNPPRVYVCLGTPAEHLEELKDVAAGALWTKWTINKGAVEGDQVVFYMLKPLSAFVAAGIVEDAPRLEDDESSGWYGHYMTDISGVQMLPWLVPISQARTRFPQWGWLRQPRQSTLVPSDFTNELLGFLRASTPPSPPAGESDIRRHENRDCPVQDQEEPSTYFVISLSKRLRVSAMSASAISPRFWVAGGSVFFRYTTANNCQTASHPRSQSLAILLSSVRIATSFSISIRKTH